jgi:D-aspartate ligase
MSSISAEIRPSRQAPERSGRRAGNPPVLILNLFHSGLAIARDLVGRNVRVIGLSADRSIYGNFTRFCEVRFVPNSQEEPEQLAEELLQFASELSGSVIFPTRDADVLFLDRYREELSAHYRLALPAHDCLLRVMDKHALASIAEKSGTPVPRTARLSSAAELRRVEMEVGFPCVLKPVYAVSWRTGEGWIKVGGRKAILVDNQQQLEHEYEIVSSVDPEVLVQQWIPGSAEQIVICGGYVSRGGDALAYFTARKLVQSPDDFGTGCLVESMEIPEIVQLTRRLWKSLRYEGMAEVEYKQDKNSGRYYLIEINTRHWDWHGLGGASGINLTWTAYCDLTGRLRDQVQMPIVRAKWIAEDALLIYVLKALYHRQIGLGELQRKLSGRRMYSVFAWNDPLPWLRYWFLVLLPDLAKSIFKKIGGGWLS